MKYIIKIILGVYFALLLTSISIGQTGLTEAEDFLVKDVTGTTFNLFPLLEEGKIVVLPFFTTTCGSCNIYTPEIVESYQDFGCNEGDVFYLGINWGANNIGVIDFMAVHAVEYPCASGLEGLGNETHIQYEIASNITALVILPDGSIAGNFYGPNAYPTRDSLNSLLVSLGAQMQNCSVGLQEINENKLNIFPNPSSDQVFIQQQYSTNLISSVKLVDIMGHELINMESSLEEEIRIDLVNIPTGIYFLHINFNDQTQLIKKIIKK